MANEQLFREYKLTDSELTMFTQHICDCITRDSVEFASFNVLTANVTALQALCDAYEIFPTDEFINQEYLSATEVKDNLIAEIKVMMRNIALRVELKWGKSSPKYKSLGIADMSKISDEAFTTRARMLSAFAEEYLVELAIDGLTQAMIDDFNEKIQDLDDAKREQIEKASYRIEKTTERITKGNELYNLVSRYCEIGKRIWDGVNPAFFNDYIIYTSVSPGSLTAPANLRYNTQYYKIEWDAVENATSYQLEISSDGVNYTELVSQSENEFSHIPYDVHTWVRCRARNSGGYGEYSAVLEIWYYEPLPAPANFQAVIIPGHQYKLSWDLIHSVTSYKIYISDVPFGEPESVFAPLYETSALEYTGAVTPGRRYYFKVTSKNSYQPESGYSSTMYVEITGV